MNFKIMSERWYVAKHADVKFFDRRTKITKYYIQSNLIVDPKKVLSGEIWSYAFTIGEDEIKTIEYEIVEEVEFLPGEDKEVDELRIYYHVKNEYWNTLLQRSGFREKDWKDVTCLKEELENEQRKRNIPDCEKFKTFFSSNT